MEDRVENMGPAVSVKTFVLFDTESTGLPSPGNNPRITELCFIAVTREELLTKQEYPRVLNKLVICFNPCKKIGPFSSHITGLHNDALEDMTSFNQQVPLITMFLRNLPQPVCLIAHNGNAYDFPLLVSHLRCAVGEIPESILCTDSLEALRTFDGLPAVPEFLLQRRQANSLATVKLTADPQVGKSLKKIGEASGNMLELNRTQSTENDGETNMETHQSCNNSSDNLKRTAETLEISDINSKHPKLSSPHAVVWEKVEHTPHVSKTTKLFGPELINYSEELRKRSNKVKHNLFKEDSGSDIENNKLGSDLHPVSGDNMMPTCQEDVNFRQNIPAKSVNDRPLFVEGSSHIGNTSITNEIAQNGTRTVISSNSVNYNISSLAGNQDDIIGRLESSATCVGGKAASSPAATQNHYGLGNNSVGPLTSSDLAERNVNEIHNVHQAKKLSYSLPIVYARMFGKKPSASHTAEGDCRALLKILRSKVTEFASWCDSFAVPLMSISPMY